MPILATALLITLAGGALVLVKPRQKAVAEQRAVQATIDAFTDNARARRADARALRADSEASIKANDYQTAMSERLKMIERDKPVVSILGALSFYAIQSLALDDIGRIASRLDAPAARRFVDQLEAQDAKLFTYSQILAGQKAEELKQIDGIAAKGDWDKVIEGLNFSAQEKAVLKNTPLVKVRDNVAKFYDSAIADAKLPYSPTRAKPAMALDPYSTNFATAYVADRFAWARAKTQRLLIVVALRARADRLENKTATASLSPDPFGTGQLQATGGVIYSVGPDAVDNGGRLVPTPYKATAKGDILAPTF